MWPLVAAIGLGYSTAAAAQPAAGTAAAEALFQEGRTLLMGGKINEACPKLAESQRLDPATGTLMALALCHEQQGKLASAWAEFADVEGRSRGDGRPDRERTAREHGAALRPRLSTLALDVPREVADVPGLAIAIDGVPIGRAAWDTAIPVDGGERVVEATVPDRPPWKTTVSVRREQDRVRVVVRAPAQGGAPVVTAVAEREPDRAAEPTSEPISKQPVPTNSGSARRTTAIVLMAAGAVGLGAAAWLGLDARSDYQEAVKVCPSGAGGRVCPPDAYARAQDARDQGNLATIVAIGGAAVALTGVTLWLWPSAGDGADKGTRLSVIPGGLSLQGSF